MGEGDVAQVIDDGGVREWLPWSARRYVPGAWPVVAGAITSGEVRELVVEGGVCVRAVPIDGPEGAVFGVRVWQGKQFPDGPPPAAGGFAWQAGVRVFHQSFACANMSGTSFEEFIADRPTVDFTRRALRFDHVAELVDILHTPTVGKRFLRPVTVVHVQTGQIMAWQMILEADSDTGGRGFFYDTTPHGVEPDLPSPSEFAQRQLAAAEGRGLALGVRQDQGAVPIDAGVDSDGEDLIIGTWLTDPPPGVSVDRVAGRGQYLVPPASRRALAQARPGESVEVQILMADGKWGPAQAVVLPYMRGAQPDPMLVVIEFRLPQRS
ncbi:GAF domain-containing protein [Tsukamurella sp. TY48]|uniref:GAF domain-containing protein n=1 Tax=Tsukamurella TaxID=2060 RepID=UPI001C7CAE32|nr:GAF domain-containing protein [Tsukamurella sp. TY48]